MGCLEFKLMDSWEFAFNQRADRNFHSVALPYDWAIERPFSRWMNQRPQKGEELA